MKKNYTRPIVANSDVASNNNGVYPIFVAAAAAAAARKAMKAAPVSKLQSLTRRNSN